MSIPSVYINLEDDVTKITERLKRQPAKQIVLVCPKRCFLFSDSINLKLLKKQTDLLSKDVSILTMDEKGQGFAKEAGFALKFLPKPGAGKVISDIKVSPNQAAHPKPAEMPIQQPSETGFLASAAQAAEKINEAVKKFVPIASSKNELPAQADDVFVSETKTAQPEAFEPDIKIKQNFFPPEIEKEYREPKAKSRTQRWITATVAASLILILLLVFVVLPKATVTVYARSEPVTRDMEISVSGNTAVVDIAKLVIPGTKVEEVISLTEKFPSKGKKAVGNKASGGVKIYNFTGSPINLKSATTFLTVAGKNYQLVSDVNYLKVTTYKNAQTKEVNEASLGSSYQIIAAEGGEEYNLPAGTRLEVTNQVFGSKPQFLYAKTDSEIKGGTTRYLSLISQEDINSAKAALQEKALADVRQQLDEKGMILAEGAFTIETPDFATDNPAGTETTTFQAVGQTKISGIAFKKDDLTNLISQRIAQTLSSNKSLKSKSLDQTVYKVKAPIDLNNKLAVLEAHFQGQAVYNLDLPDLAPQLVGKTVEQVNEILRSKAEIDKVEVTLAPSWQKNFPFFASKIKVMVGME